MSPLKRQRSNRLAFAALCLLLWGCIVADSEPESTERGPSTTMRVEDPFPLLDPADFCATSGYLCTSTGIGFSGGTEAGPGDFDAHPRVARWPDDVRILRILLPLPPVDDSEGARELQRAALRGLLAWDGHPIPIQVLDRDVAPGTPVDIVVSWLTALEPGQAGRVRTRWQIHGESYGFEVVRFDLALEVKDPESGRVQTLEADDVARVAAHEMGHALGLGHSDAPGDLMYPTNTAEALSPRDYRTVDALYRLPAGSRIGSAIRR